MLQSKNDNAIYPLIAIASSIVIFVGSLLTATHHGYYYFLVISLLLIAFKMWRQYLTILPYGIIVSSIFFGICYAITKNVEYSIAGCLRIAGLCIAIVPSSSIPPVNLTRALNQLKCPRALCLGILITIKFFPMLNDEIKQIRMAMKTRGATNSLRTLYRSTILPFCVRLVNISDLLALSVETRAFGATKNASSFKVIKITYIDILYAVAILCLTIIGTILLIKGVI